MHRGSCLCGRVRYELSREPGEFGYCHCTSCRKASGSAHAANAPVDRDAFTLTAGDDVLREFESSHHATRIGAGQPVGGIGEVDHRDYLVDPRCPLLSGDVEKPREPADVLATGESTFDRKLLRHVPEKTPDRHRPRANVDAENLDFADL